MKIKMFYLISIFFIILFPTTSLANSEQKVIKIMGDRAFPPYEYINKNGKPDGFNVELFKAIMDINKLPYEIVLDDWTTVMDSFRNGNADLITGIIFSGTMQYSYKLGASHNFVRYCLVSREKDEPDNIENLKDKEVFIVEGSSAGKILENNNISTRILNIVTIEEGLMRLSLGEGDYSIAPDRKSVV